MSKEKNSYSPQTILTFCLIVIIATFVYLGSVQLKSVSEMRHIITTDFSLANTASTPSSIIVTNDQGKTLNPTLQKELHGHLVNKIKATYSAVAAIAIGVFALFFAWIYTQNNLRRFKEINTNEKRLEELLYYDKVKELQQRAPEDAPMPLALIDMQRNRETFVSELERALAKNEFVLNYQPIVDLHTNRVIGAEALLAWQHPQHGFLTPDNFLSLCEITGIIIPLGKWVLRQACTLLKAWHAMGYEDLSISINISPRQLADSDLYDFIAHLLHEMEIPARSLKLEITESMLAQAHASNIKLLHDLRHLGLKLSLDDFGTGFSSLNYLKQFSFDILKIDRSFVRDMTTNITNLAIVESIITLGKSLGLTLIAEGVEDDSQLYLLKKFNCDMYQGYLYSKAVSIEKFTDLLSHSYSKTSAAFPIKNAVADLEHYHFAVLQQEHYDQAVALIATTFCEHEPMTKYLGFSTKEYLPFVAALVTKAIQDGLSVAALDGGTLHACTIVEDIADPLDIKAENIDPRFRIIFSMLEHLGRDFFQEKEIQKGHLAHLYITAVDSKYFARGLAKKINFESIKLAQQKKYDFMCCEFTHHYHEQGTMRNVKNNKLLIHTCQYKDFVFEGKKPFENLEGYASAYIWELRDGAKLQYHIKQ